MKENILTLIECMEELLPSIKQEKNDKTRDGFVDALKDYLKQTKKEVNKF